MHATQTPTRTYANSPCNRTRFSGPGIAQIVMLALTLAVWGFPIRAAAQPAPSPLPPQTNSQFDGELEVQYEDANNSSRLRHFLRTDGGQRLELQFSGKGPGLLTGSRIRARGALQGNTLMLAGGSSSVTTLSLAAPNTFGQQPTIVILVNFQDNQTQPYSLSSAQDVTFNQTSAYYLENSYGQTWFTGTVVGWFTIPANSTTCDTNSWASLADQAATNAGVSLAGYGRRVYGFPQTNACAWWGLGTIGGNPSRAWINGSYALRVVSHELGHNLGDYHSHSMACDLSTCTASEYGDDHDTMGGTIAHFNAYQKERLGWLNYGSSPTIQTVSTGNSYWLDPYETSGGSYPKALKIWNANNSSYYYIESRASIGFDGSVLPGIVVHRGSPTDGNTSYQLDIAPTTTAWDSLLDVGQVFKDDAIGLNVQTLSTSSAGSVVSIIFGTTACNAAAPTVSLAYSSFLKYTLTVINNDGVGCTAAPFNLAASVPTGWTASFNPASLSSLTPGSSASTTLTLAAPTGTSGTFSFGATATNSSSGYSGSASESVTLATSLTVTTSAIVTSTGNNRAAIIGSTVKVGSAPFAGASVSVVLTSPAGKKTTLTATTAADGMASVKFSLKPKDPSGTYQVATTASGNGATGSAATSFVVP